jgi:diguanylate cyclase (GGDEF)-like protein
MPKLTALSLSEPDPSLLTKVDWLKRALLGAAAFIAAATLAAWFLPALGRSFPHGWSDMKANTALAVLLAVFSLHFSEPQHPRRIGLLSQALAVFVSLIGFAALAEFRFHLSLGIDTLLAMDGGPHNPFPGRMAPQTAEAIAIMGIALFPIQAQKRFATVVADLLASSLCLIVLLLVSGYLFGALPIFGLFPTVLTSPQSLVCFAMLTAVTVLRRAENGMFSIFLGRGIGSKTARALAPVLLVLSFLREASRARLVLALKYPEPDVTALLATVATTVSFILLLFLTWRIHKMEVEIRDLSLRDELTGLRNLRGFHLLAEQALRLAQRSQRPLSVLFVDLDNLKEINDSLGHAIGSAFISETAGMLKNTFRETDVMARIGGDEFAVVCQCSHVDISIAAQRLEAAVAQRNTAAARPIPFSFSIGYVTSEEHERQSLKDLLAQADQAMYQEKRRKKITRD